MAIGRASVRLYAPPYERRGCRRKRRKPLMSDPRDGEDRDAFARLRFSIIGPLLAAPPAPGELYGVLRALSAKTWRHPRTDLPISFAASTIERWYYAARAAH